MTCMNLVITGNPGVGKHTIAEHIQNHDSSFVIYFLKFQIYMAKFNWHILTDIIMKIANQKQMICNAVFLSLF